MSPESVRIRPINRFLIKFFPLLFFPLSLPLPPPTPLLSFSPSPSCLFGSLSLYGKHHFFFADENPTLLSRFCLCLLLSMKSPFFSIIIPLSPPLSGKHYFFFNKNCRPHPTSLAFGWISTHAFSLWSETARILISLPAPIVCLPLELISNKKKNIYCHKFYNFYNFYMWCAQIEFPESSKWPTQT